MIKKLLTFIIISAICFSAGAQGQADKWYFGALAGLDFSGGSPVAISGSLNTAEGTSAVSSAAGDLLFYTDGVTVWDSTDTQMPNGTGLTGNGSSTQSALIVPSPSSPTMYYIFTTAADGGSAGFRYSIVDMNLNGGLGDLTNSKNIAITDSCDEKISAIKDAAGAGYWILMHKWGSNNFCGYHLTASGLSAPVISSVGIVHTATPTSFQNTYGQMKFNMCGDRLALATGYLNTVELFDFNNATGMVSNPITLSMGYHVYGIEFSKNSGLLYVTSYDPSSTLNQYNITLGTQSLIAASKVPLSSTADLYALQIGPDGKIYVAESFGSPFLGVINNPDTYGFGANYTDMGILLDPGGMGVMGGLGLPSFLQDYLKTNVTCSVGITEINVEENAYVYPNPSNSGFTIPADKEINKIEVYDPTGRLIETLSSLYETYNFGTNYSSGMYFIYVSGPTGKHFCKAIKN